MGAGAGYPASGADVADDRWTEAALAGLGPDEHDFQEFKGAGLVVHQGQVAPDFLPVLSKQVSAFANGAGGRIFLGVDDRGQVDGGVPVDLRKGGTRSWLEDVVPGLVDPPLSVFNVYEVPPDGADSRIAPGHAVYVVEVAASASAPHQALDHRYYLRIAGKSRPMGHVHLQDVLRRTRHPDVHVQRIAPYGPPERVTTDPRGPKVMLSFRIFLENRGRTLAQHVGLELAMPRPVVNRDVRRRMTEAGAQLTQRAGTVSFFRYHPNPMFPGQDLFFLQVWVAVHGGNVEAIRQGAAAIAWRVYADDAPAREGTRPVVELAGVRDALAWVGRAAGVARPGPSIRLDPDDG